MIYLVIFFAVAGSGIVCLWLYQRHQRKHMSSVDGFRASLERISGHRVSAPAPRPGRDAAAVRPGDSRRPEPLDPARREAARRRLERRRAARA